MVALRGTPRGVSVKAHMTHDNALQVEGVRGWAIVWSERWHAVALHPASFHGPSASGNRWRDAHRGVGGCCRQERRAGV